MSDERGKVGIGIITCNRPEYLTKLLESMKNCNWAELVIINDGSEVDIPGYNYYVINNETNLGVGKSKNKAMQHLLDKGCDYIFIIEDDMIILDETVFDRYIDAHKASGIHHFNYGPGSPFNRKQTIQNFDLHNRHLLDQHTEPNPKLVIDYGNVKVSLFEHTVAMFSFFTKEVLEKVGLIDDAFYNAWEHVDHTYRIIKAGYHPPFWWFADLYDSHSYLTEAPEAINNSSIANNTEQWNKNVYGGREIYKQKHGHYPNEPPYVTKDQVTQIIKQLKQSYKTNKY
jgi:GT2 family glycosyltransferase